MTSAASTLASWATSLDPSDEDLALADRSLKDTLAVMYAARQHPLRQLFEQLADPGRLAALAHVLDFDDLHMASTTHISAICVPVALASGGDARAYLAGAGVMARLGTALGWRHYTAGWHATCTAGAPAAAATAAVARGLGAERTRISMALAVPAAGGVQRAFGTSAKALQVGFAAQAGVRAAALAAAGATADPRALDDWLALIGGDPAELADSAERGATPAIPGGLAIKLYPCCYALQRPISALAELQQRSAHDPEPAHNAREARDADVAKNSHNIRAIHVTTPTSSLKPLIHSSPTTGLEGKFSLEYAVAATFLDGRPDQSSFTDEAVQRSEARRLMDLVEITPIPAGDGLLDGEVTLEITMESGESSSASLKLPPGAPDRPPTNEELLQKLEACAGGKASQLAGLTWETAASFLAQI